MSDKKCVREKYLYLSAMLRAREARMLTREKAERMISAASFSDAAKMLTDCGYADMSGMSPKELDGALNGHRAAIFSEIAAISPDRELVDIFRMKYDYHNAKTLIKAEARGVGRGDLMSGSGRIAPEALEKSFTEENYLSVPPVLAAAMNEAKQTLARSQNPQLSDLILDRAYFAELSAAAEKLGSRFLSGYAKTLIDGANLRAAVRTLRMKKDPEFLKSVLTEGGETDLRRVLQAASSAETLPALYAGTVFKNAAELGAQAAQGGSLTEFELACDNAVTAYLTGAKLTSYGEAPVIAYLAAVEDEIRAVRMILTGFAAGISPDTVRERLREFYA